MADRMHIGPGPVDMLGARVPLMVPGFFSLGMLGLPASCDQSRVVWSFEIAVWMRRLQYTPVNGGMAMRGGCLVVESVVSS